MNFRVCSSLMLVWLNGATAFVLQPQQQATSLTQQQARRPAAASNRVDLWKLYASTKDGDDAPPEIQPLTTSFDDAGSAIIDEEDEERMKSMGDFDTTSGSQENIQNMRAAIQERAKSLGYEKSKVSQQYIEQAQARARNQAANRAAGGGSNLDLSQISTGDEPKKKSDWDESMPAMMYDPADELTEEEQKEADKVGQLPIWQQFMEEVQASQWPDLGSVIREMGVIAAVVVVTAALIINWDGFLRTFYTDLGLIPSPEQTNEQVLDVDLIPEGFTNNMNEDDLAKITQEMNARGSKSPSVEKLLDSASPLNPDL
ncbi:expressed unknown protein [Seminavis robusta]|uniref:Uncharacterized protein n=1 Tax=Seminavis robusta TaxID=568900 RepID=A0A9N8E711_9STRA|nr:expressed unknown protein [Seminavis robusta]|eukprot:Sro581_g170310.1 n/a (315) ;mRNA; f:35006-36099